MPVDARPVVDFASWLEGKTLADLGAIQHGRHLLFPEAFRVKGPKGEDVHERVLVKVPTRADRALACIDAVAHVQSLKRKMRIETVDEAKAAVGESVFEELDTYAIVARCTFEVAPPHQQFMLLSILHDSFIAPVVLDVYERLAFYQDLLDPRIGELTDDQFLGAMAAIARFKTTGPLAVMRGHTQSAFIVRLASELWSARTLSSSSAPSETSTPES